jgi:hypothetical protein
MDQSNTQQQPSQQQLDDQQIKSTRDKYREKLALMRERRTHVLKKQSEGMMTKKQRQEVRRETQRDGVRALMKKLNLTGDF